MRMRKHNYGEIYNYAKQYGREKTMKTYGVSAPVLSCVIATGDDLLATMKRSSTPPYRGKPSTSTRHGSSWRSLPSAVTRVS